MSKAIQINIQILKKCREQMGLSQADVKKKVKKIAEIEDADREPTPKQLTTLAELYQVPRWVFIENKLPLEYQYERMPTFRQFKKSTTFNLPKLRQLVSRVEQYRRLFLELREDMDEPVPQFFTSVAPSDSAEQTAKAVRKWLNLVAPLDFDSLREKLEEQNIFIFMTSKYKGWSQIDKESFRGLSIFYDILPVIVINDSDYKKSQSFTLFHELGHLLKKHMAIGCENIRKKKEKWCDELAGCVLMPSDSNILNQSIDQLREIKKVAKQFKVSPYSCLVRLKQLGAINQKKYISFENQLKKEYKALQIKLKNELQKNDRRLPRYRHLEVKKQFGNSFIIPIFHALHNREITLHKASQILELKKPSQVLELEKSL